MPGIVNEPRTLLFVKSNGKECVKTVFAESLEPKSLSFYTCVDDFIELAVSSTGGAMKSKLFFIDS